ncbi:hypothetical protein [Paenibacillus gallinarum]|uniref:hypothetical protein n=1 Tax=Paenibacillus gallinarum TaxID=2762232 RepID=UPI001787128A|nr:hypothetical protein [Paenibacillus gallinarum]
MVMNMSYNSWFVPLCIFISIVFGVAIFFITINTLILRRKTTNKYNRRKISG